MSEMTNNQPQFDAFLAHNSLDKYLIRQIKTKLENLARDRNLDLKLWLDEEQIGEDGVSFHIKQGISQSRCVVFFIGLNLLGKWGLKLELQIAEQLAIESDLKLIPVLLPGVQKMPDDPIYSFLKTKLWINFNSIDDAEALDKLFGRIPKSREIKVPEQRVNQIPKISPKDYTTLEKLLSKGRWEVANNLTYQLMVKVVGQNNGYKLTDKDLKNFPCEDLLKIDSLWVKHSQGKFGFSVQKTIYLSVGGEFNDGFEIHIWQDLCDRVGWRVNGDFLDDGQDEEYTFDFSAPTGHLPLLNTYAEGLVIFLFPRLEACIQSQTIKPLEFLNSYLGYTPNTSVNQAVKIIKSYTNIQPPIDTDDLSSERGIDYTNLYPFLISRNQSKDYGVIVAPDFLAANEFSALRRATQYVEETETESGTVIHWQVKDHQTDFTFIFRVDTATRKDIGEDSLDGLTDTVYRRIKLVFGVVYRGLIPQNDVTISDEYFQKVRKYVRQYYQSFWNNQSDQVFRSQQLPNEDKSSANVLKVRSISNENVPKQNLNPSPKSYSYNRRAILFIIILLSTSVVLMTFAFGVSTGNLGNGNTNNFGSTAPFMIFWNKYGINLCLDWV